MVHSWVLRLCCFLKKDYMGFWRPLYSLGAHSPQLCPLLFDVLTQNPFGPRKHLASSKKERPNSGVTVDLDHHFHPLGTHRGSFEFPFAPISLHITPHKQHPNCSGMWVR